METLELNLMDSEWYELMKLAHERDITLNQLCNIILRDAVADNIILRDHQADGYTAAECQEITIGKLAGETPWDLK
jgi:hypothetical protein